MELIKVSEQNGKSVVSARELHQFLEAGSNVNTWFKNQVDRAMLTENEDFIQIFGESTGGRPSVDYASCRKMCNQLGLVIGKVPDPRFGSVNTYPLDVLSQIIY